MIELRPYQSKLIGDLRDGYRAGNNRQLLVLATAGGKTIIFSFVTKGAVERGLRTMVIAHRHEILDQISRTLNSVSVKHSMVQSGVPLNPSSQVQVASIQTLVKRFDRLPEPDLIIIDEAHRSAAQTYTEVFARYSKARFLGVTATPERLDGRGLGEFYQSIVRGPEVQWLIDNGFLARPIYYAPASSPDLTGLKIQMGDFNKSQIAGIMDKPSITGCAVQHYKRYLNGRTAIAFTISIDHAKHVAEQFNQAGIPAASIDGKLSSSDRESRFDSLRQHRIFVLTSCELVSEGVDIPSVGGALLLRPTASLAMHLQQVGRCLRPKADGNSAIILDHVGNCLRHGLAEEPRDWTLEGKTKSRRKEPEENTQRCETCFAIYRGATCPQCGEEKQSKGREIQEVDGQLTALDAAAVLEQRKKRREEAMCKTREDFALLAKARGYKPGWAWHRWRTSHWNKKEVA